MSGFIDKIALGSNPGAIDGTGYIGGSHREESDHPYVKGYFYAFFGLPSELFNKDNSTLEDSKRFLLVSAETFTPPGDRQMNMQDVQGQGGVGASFVVGQTISREFSIQYKDFWGAPIFRIHRIWTGFINPYLGGSFHKQFAAKNYKGACMVIQTKPVIRNVNNNTTDNILWSKEDIIKIDYFDGVVPTTDLKSAYDSNITDNSFVKPTVQYKFDGYPLDETDTNVMAKAIEILNNKELFKATADLYTNLPSAALL